MNNILVTRCDLCQYLLNMGYRIVSIARNRYDRDKTVFYFKEENNIKEAIKSFKK